MQAGILKNVVEIYECVISSNDFGHIKPTYTFKYKTRANVRYNSGNRQVDNDEIFFGSNVTFTVRKYVPVEHTSRIKYNGKFYRILSIEESGVLNNLTIITELINE